MENLKIRVNNEAESKEAQELFFELGYRWVGEDKNTYWETLSGWIFAKDITKILFSGSVNSDVVYKEITINQLRDMVVLKRNCVDDATHTCDGQKYYLTGSEFFEYINGHWENVDEYVDGCIFETIEKPMKEYLIKQNGEYVLIHANFCPSGGIEVPEGATHYSRAKYGGNCVFFKIHNTDEYEYYNDTWVLRTNPLNKMYLTTQLLWQRNKTEELPFIDDEPTMPAEQIDITVKFPRDAETINYAAMQHIIERGKTYDSEAGERSAHKTAQAFNAVTGHNITEAEVFLLLQILKDVRQWSKDDYHQDSAEDCISYAVLKAEALEREVKPLHHF